MSNITGKGGGGGGKNAPQDVNVPAFTSSGGITPQQDALGQYTLGEQLLGQANAFGGEGLGDSTMATQGAGGARDTTAQAVNQMSDTNEQAQYGLYTNDVNALEQSLGNQATLNQGNQASLSGLASLAGFGSGTATSGAGGAAAGDISDATASDAALGMDIVGA